MSTFGMSPEATQRYAQLMPAGKDLVDYFQQHHRFRFVRSLMGPRGGALLCEEVAPSSNNDNNNGEPPAVQRKLVIKHGLNKMVENDLRNEIEILRILRGSEHIVRVVEYTDPESDIRSPESPLRSPYLVMEFTPGGTISTWIGRHHDETVLWSIFLCRKFMYCYLRGQELRRYLLIICMQ